MNKKNVLLVASLLSISPFAFILTGCGGGGGAAVSTPPLPAYYVDSATGNDTNSGTQAAPFKTLTMAINAVSAVAATGGANIYAAPGIYDAASGEVFPITPTTGENLIGDIANKGLGATATKIVGAATYTITGGFYAGGWDTTLVIPPGVIATVSGFDIAGAYNGILVEKGIAVIASNTLKNQTGGGSDSLTILNGGYALVTANDIQTTGWCSVGLHDPTTFATLRNNIITSLAGSFGDAILVTSDASVDMGTLASSGNNTVLADPLNSVGLNVTSTSATALVTAIGNTWQPNVQGADGVGHYSTSFVVAPGAAYVAGNNYANPSVSAPSIPLSTSLGSGFYTQGNRR